MLSNIDLAFQTSRALINAKECVEMSKKYSYSLSFTGYSFGAWLAEQSVYFSHRDFNKKDTKAVTFESPGSMDFMDVLNRAYPDHAFDLGDLDITTFLGEPNFFNTSNTHAENAYRVYVNDNEANNQETDEFMSQVIGEIPLDTLARKSLQECYTEHVRPSVADFSFYLHGLKLFFSAGLSSILKHFDARTERPKSYKKVVEWPKVNIVQRTEFDGDYERVVDWPKLFQAHLFFDFKVFDQFGKDKDVGNKKM